MIVILVSKSDGVFVFWSFFNTAGNAGQVVCPFVEVPIVQIVFILEDVLFYVLEVENQQGWAKQRSHRWHSDRQIYLQLPLHLYSCLACITAYHIEIGWLGVGQCVLCVLCGPWLGKWDEDFVGVKLFALRFENLCED